MQVGWPVPLSLLTSGQLGSYDVFKNNLLLKHMQFQKESTSTHVTASLMASLVATTGLDRMNISCLVLYARRASTHLTLETSDAVCNPADMIKTRVMNDISEVRLGSIKMLRDVIMSEGLLALVKVGQTPSRQTEQTVVRLVLQQSNHQTDRTNCCQTPRRQTNCCRLLSTTVCLTGVPVEE